ncbi:YraN family protein [Coxiella burnetii]|uniref:UPF0102 protein CBU_1742 n=1 Tax=Coxiella burnetii (strain RSA 493 / Nine Mile phase I) TaxID=227377 RepID=Y1742_COXBU|nr:YraN family protein [Coxiella burnetii]NP_820722.1 endonuclease [Coxiella burnetii RSA 493]Q83AY5.1 RecName: Full=UPF0102 protein CBU_1742 [Coxiella burnetii RSA 493]AAO91236.1 endonuclease [Coxiella burnetii RSA 493]ARI66503.1 YraN family protein [Coxiella burnetii]ARK27944.1 YraN family protein [Coxiella burnetii]MCF2094294.1 YraN family protein [Coxiella burnetii]MCF2096311.1 YraN family protein [Coxiella burnetii]
MFSLTQKIGFNAEKTACRYLQKQGLSFITKNFRYKQGEIDLIMSDQSMLVFIEVRYRRFSDFIHPVATVTPLKQRRLIKTALHYLQKHRPLDKISCRFDIVGITADRQITWIKNAIEVEY